MLADYKLYWDPKSNLLFFPQYDTSLLKGDPKDPSTRFKVQKYRPAFDLEKYGYPHFEAVLIACFGTWGAFGWTNEAILKCFIDTIDSDNEEDWFFAKNENNEAFREFAKANPSFRNAKFPPEKSDLLFKDSGVPLKAKIRKPRSPKKAA